VIYRYRGDRFTAPEWKGANCEAVRREDGTCIRGTNGNMLVRFLSTGALQVVVGRQLRKLPSPVDVATRPIEDAWQK